MAVSAHQRHAQKTLDDLVLTYGPKAGEIGPESFVREMLGIQADDWQIKGILRPLGRCERRIAVKSSHGVGKTAAAAWVSVWSMFCRFPQKTAVTAPAAAQLQGALMPEIKKWISVLPKELQSLVDVRAEAIYMLGDRNQSYIEARTSRAENPEALQGIHCTPGHVLLIADEASGIPEQVFEAAIGSMSGHNATTLLIGNPVRTSGFFYESFHRAKAIWHTVTVRWDESPRVTEDFERQVARTYGKDSNAYRVRCLGEFPLSDDDTVIPWELVDSARGRDITDSPNAREVWGLDVARFGRDKSALAKRTNRRATGIEIWGHCDIMETVGRVKSQWDALSPSERPTAIVVDEIGMGSGVVDRLRELDMGDTHIRGVNVAESPSIEMDCQRVRDELWWRCREWFDGRDVALPAIDPNVDMETDPWETLCAELVTPTFRFRSNGKKEVESKDAMRKRSRASPNAADAFCLTFAESASTMMHGGQAMSWNTPIRRNIPSLV